MPAITTYIPGQSAKVGSASLDVNVRDAPTTSGKVIRQVPSGNPETWAVTGWVTGQNVVGSDQWITRWNAGWEYAHRSTVDGPVPPASAYTKADVDAAKVAGYAAAKVNARSAIESI